MRTVPVLLLAAALPWLGYVAGLGPPASAADRALEPQKQSPVVWTAQHGLNTEAGSASGARNLLHRGSHRRRCGSQISGCASHLPPGEFIALFTLVCHIGARTNLLIC